MQLKKLPQIISIIKRRINDNHSYNDFRNAWLPEVKGHYQIPTYVINAEKIEDPNEIISIGLVWADWDEVQKEAGRVKDKDEKRKDKVSQIAKSYGNAELYKIRNIDELSSKNFDGLIIETLKDSHIAIITENFSKKPASLFNQYLNEQKKGERKIWVAFYQEKLVGYVTLKWESKYQPFKDESIPEIKDLNILPKYRGRGYGAFLLEIAEKEASKKGNIVGLGCGLHESYGNAQRLYISKGYSLNGKGITYINGQVKWNETIKLNDDLIMWLTKKLG